MIRARVRDHLIDLLYPSECFVCGKGFVLPLCTECFNDLAASAAGQGRERHGSPTGVRFRESRAPGEYAGPLKEMVLAFKDSDRRLAAPLAALMTISGGNDPAYLHPDAICFVPSSSRKLKERGYNPAGLLAAELGRILGRPVRDALRLIRKVSDQGSIPGSLRWSNVGGAFGPHGPSLPPGKVLLVDDVLTTGATANECARVLLRHGAESVHVTVCARAELKNHSKGHFGSHRGV